MNDQYPALGTGRGPARWDWRVGTALANAAAALLGVLGGWWTPRGPVTTPQALATIGICLAVGAFAGLVMATRWAALLVPAVAITTFELVRAGTSGPLVDGINLGSPFGIIAFALGRGLHTVFAILPMLFGVALGAGLARYLDTERRVPSGWGRSGLAVRRASTALVGVALIAIVVGVGRPASTDPITGLDGRTLAGSVAELTRVRAGGHDLSVMIRGRDVSNPVLLFLAGGPGGGEMGAMRRHGQGLEREFTVATLDQRGAGTSYDQLDPTSTLTLKGAVSDAIEVTNYLRARFQQDKIYVLGNSWGTTLGVLAVQQHPELYRAFIGTGQMVSPRETDRIFYRDALAWAKRTGRHALVRTLTKSGPPPYRRMLDYEPALTNDAAIHPYDHSPNDEGAGGFSENFFVPEHSLLQQLQMLPAFLDVFTVLYPQLQHIDFRVDVPSLQVPVYLIQGRYEAPGRAVLAQQWFQALKAPKKQMIIFPTSGHRPLFEQPKLFNSVMTDIVLFGTPPSG
jgi:pimeloyl-ACP methyl ester carboxylesterase